MPTSELNLLMVTEALFEISPKMLFKILAKNFKFTFRNRRSFLFSLEQKIAKIDKKWFFLNKKNNLFSKNVVQYFPEKVFLRVDWSIFMRPEVIRPERAAIFWPTWIRGCSRIRSQHRRRRQLRRRQRRCGKAGPCNFAAIETWVPLPAQKPIL